MSPEEKVQRVLKSRREIFEHPEIIKLKLHYCQEFDGLLITKNCPEFDVCTCYPPEERGT